MSLNPQSRGVFPGLDQFGLSTPYKRTHFCGSLGRSHSSRLDPEVAAPFQHFLHRVEVRTKGLEASWGPKRLIPPLGRSVLEFVQGT